MYKVGHPHTDEEYDTLEQYIHVFTEFIRFLAITNRATRQVLPAR